MLNAITNYSLRLNEILTIDLFDKFPWVVYVSNLVMLRETEFLNNSHAKVIIDPLHQKSY